MGAMQQEHGHGSREPDQQDETRQPHSLMGPAAIFYGALMATAILWRFLAGRAGPFAVNPVREHLPVEIAVAAGALVLHVLLDLFGPRVSRAFARLFERLRSVLGTIRPAEAAALAALSAFGEEAFFRGALQPALGLWPAALIFAISHFPARRELILWPFYAFAMGLILGYLVILSGDIWSAVLLHFFVNLFSLLYMSRSGSQQDAPGSDTE